MIFWLALLLAAVNFAGLVYELRGEARFGWSMVLALGCGACISAAMLA